MKEQQKFKVTDHEYPFILERSGTEIARLHHIAYPRLTVTFLHEEEGTCMKIETEDVCDFKAVNEVMKRAMDFMRKNYAKQPDSTAASKASN